MFSGYAACLRCQSVANRESGGDCNLFGDDMWNCQHSVESNNEWNHSEGRQEHGHLANH